MICVSARNLWSLGELSSEGKYCLRGGTDDQGCRLESGSAVKYLTVRGRRTMCWTGGTAEFGATPTGQWCTDFILQRSSLDKGSLRKGAPSALFIWVVSRVGL